eukprot:CAMPEP_0198235348 /NCGR_PEP_ID=MMETSP1446-20131203/1260_1 /TAXON_ID=1461542 ORGANISM="Unidentified sp, Strain CCMP2111" /NCGR_SAMPLE_ID=MMETSP1446 /ASSEMBLY_ACC=CAM_ASM_001112 /LENGTH=288 /DNA_ID=CAMNT_0043916483 /DNA_START=68 /DNA_END=934 /DNA_ORIENTATION=+
MADMHARKGKDAKEKADKKLKGWGLFGNKFEEASELYEQAANSFKLAKQWKEAAECYDLLSECFVKLESLHEAASAMGSAAGCVKKVDPKLAIPYFSKSSDFYCNMGRLGMAAKALREAAEQLEAVDSAEDALAFYERAVDLFETENQNSETNKCKLKMATINAELERYTKAIGLFEDVAKKSVDNNLLKYSVKGYLLQAGICHLCTADVESMKGAMERYEDLDVTFSGTREYKFLEELIAAIEEGDVDQFTNVIAEFDSMTRLDAWKTKLLLRAKKVVDSAGEDDLT